MCAELHSIIAQSAETYKKVVCYHYITWGGRVRDSLRDKGTFKLDFEAEYDREELGGQTRKPV